MGGVPKDFPSNWFDHCIRIEDFMYARDLLNLQASWKSDAFF